MKDELGFERQPPPKRPPLSFQGKERSSSEGTLYIIQTLYIETLRLYESVKLGVMQAPLGVINVLVQSSVKLGGRELRVGLSTVDWEGPGTHWDKQREKHG